MPTSRVLPSFHRPIEDPTRSIRLWLHAIAVCIALTAIVGAATRLTGSGLSITEWNVIVGVVPPLTHAQWLDAFAKYKQIPQYEILNKDMTLAGFQAIFWWEWAHRILGRLIGVVFALPLAVFWLRGRLPAGLGSRLLGLLALGGLQGFVGWYMVSSGLVERTEVSPYRLALHLGLAVLIFALVLWTAFGLAPAGARVADLATLTPMQRRRAWLLAGLVYLQVMLGALVAGLKAGRTYNTWPLMDGALVPDGLAIMTPWWKNLFENVATVQFNHRLLAYVVVALALVHAAALIGSADSPRVRRTAGLLAAVTLAQAALGIWTLLAWVPLWLGVLHQAGALLLVVVVVAHLDALRRSRPRSRLVP